MKRVMRTLFLFGGVVIIFLSQCKFKSEVPSSDDNLLIEKIERDHLLRDSFVQRFSKNNWPEKKILDSFNLSDLSDTFYIESAGLGRGYPIHILYTSTPNYYGGLVEKTININDTEYFIGNEPLTIINAGIRIANCRFSFEGHRHGRYLHNILFQSHIYLENNTFPDSTSIVFTEFRAGLNFLDTSINGNFPKFEQCLFPNGLNFNLGLGFRGTTSMTSVMPIYYIKTVGSNFHSDLIISYCKINKTLDLSWCNFNNNSTLILDNTPLPDTLNLSSTKFSGILDLRNSFTDSGRICYINLLNTDIDKVKMRYNNFRLHFPKYILNNDQSKDLVNSTYEGLLNNFKKNGFADSYEKLDVEYRDWQSKTDWVLKISGFWWKFGYQKWRILLFTFGFIFLFSLFNYNKYKQLQIVYPIQGLQWKNIPYSSNDLILLSRKYFTVLLYTGLLFFRLSINYKNVNFNPMRYVVLIIFQYTIGLICTGFLINWILKG